MRNSGNAVRGPANQREFNPDEDRYPAAVTALRRIIEEGDMPEGPIESLEVNVTASGELTYRIRAPRAEETEGGWLPAPG